MINVLSFSTIVFASKLTSSLSPGANGSAWLLVEVVKMLGEVACVMGAMGACAGAAAMIGATWLGMMGFRGILHAEDVL